jgi:phosphoribosylanthranilate isomerase
MNIKICGVTSMKETQQLDGMDIDFAGIVFNKQSAQFVDGRINAEALRSADLDIAKVGIFVNAELNEILQTVADFNLDMVQLEGNESADFCRKLSADTTVIKSFFIDGLAGDAIDDLLLAYDDACDYYAFDTVVKKDFSGIAPSFDWQQLAAAKIEKPFFIGGGIKPEDAVLVSKFKHPDFFGVDLNCFFEKEPGVKDMAQVLKFKHDLRQFSLK